MDPNGSSGMQARSDATHEFRVNIGLRAFPSVSDGLLEELTMRVEDTLSANAAKIAPGASASADLVTRTIELDFVVLSTAMAIHGLVGELTRIALESIEPDAVTFWSSATSSTSADA
jgi:hypothetical protein